MLINTVRRTLLLLTFVVGLYSCKKNDTQPDGGSSTGSVKVTQNGTVITQFSVDEVTVVGGGGYSIVIASTDTRHSIVLSIEGQSAGTYPFIKPHETLTSGRANFLYQSYDLPPTYAGTDGVLIPNAGQVQLTTATSTRCAGSFSGAGQNDKDGKTYAIEGTFDAPVR
ncbi:hypothetical protein [Spirosoma rhododendri]|uniref:Uncharacterized protein n=1 Tax=Spirosoma rhododendri TaxID=2728024 RepID=A0A7L5DGB3_9BACT|nr:hypothetical protein [Spirosoma rhododendri]QJD77266.1 hypothetical protein HH216_01640 [Spirosoma rhododendri]